MKQVAHNFMKTAVFSFLVLAGLALTPLSFFPRLLAFATTGWDEAFFVYLFLGAPFGGFLLLLILSRSGDRLRDTASLAGVWAGAIAGSFAGVKLMGAS
ncbi:hypothetical protein [Leisingera sp. ANG-M6]|uniref:hypothetical protein n=1 Tax=Leisingera sp. ANG-M6 TaxID=1577900 RepID=UPI00057C42D5|nr:hypothetical protein [Leisingera sp. ANG-M6]KIC31132.1 hypothetical protein RA24_00260 [Leisingera sp. ANG-M6]